MYATCAAAEQNVLHNTLTLPYPLPYLSESCHGRNM